MNKILMTSIIILVYNACLAVDVRISSDWDLQYNELQKQISPDQKSAKAKATVKGSKILDQEALIYGIDKSPVDVKLRRTKAMISRLKTMKNAYVPESSAGQRLIKFEKQLDEFEQNWKSGGSEKEGQNPAAVKQHYMDLSKIARGAALNNPLLDGFDDILFSSYRNPSGDRHMCDQYYGWNVRNGTSIYIVKNFNSDAPEIIDVLENSIVENGRLKGQKLTGGGVLSPDLSYDAKTVLFAWSTEEEQCYHIFKVNIDGSGLIQLTDGKSQYGGHLLSNVSHNDFDPVWLPNGRIAFITERRGGYLRCSGKRPCPTFAMYSMKADGTDMYPLSYHETNEWHPSVNNDGMIVYTRWDYIDRDDCIAHHIWQCYPDGRDPRSFHGNYPLPHETFTSKGVYGKDLRPNMEVNIRAIPGSKKYIATAASHHRSSFNQLVMLDLNIPDDSRMSQVAGITTGDVGQMRDGRSGPWGTAWPLSEDFYLCNYGDSVVLLDRFGNRDLIVKTSDIKTDAKLNRLVDPIPLRPRPLPTVIPIQTYQGERSVKAPKATIGVMDVYNCDIPLPRNVKIKWMRVVQIFPQVMAKMNAPQMGYGSETLARMPLGIVPVEEDGSVFFEAPVAKEIYFQLLDENGMAVHSMRSGTYVHCGERLSCVGCHEDKWKSPPPKTIRLAMKRAPSKLQPEVSSGAVPYNWHILAKPVLQQKCARCHIEKKKGPDMSYESLAEYTFYWPYQRKSYTNKDLRASGSKTTPGRFGALESKLLKGGYLNKSHYDVELTPDELRRITLWLDMNSNELGAYYKVEEQRRGEVVWPKLDLDINDPLGLLTFSE